MQRKLAAVMLIISLALGLIALNSVLTVQAVSENQQPTVAIPTVTGTPQGPIVTVREDGEAVINVRSGPGIFYTKVGVMLKGQTLPAIGKSTGGDWILIEYPGVTGGEAWVYSPFVNLSPGAVLPIVEPPPTPTPLYTNTIDPTLAAQFIVTVMPTGLPTFTQAPPINIPTYEAAEWSGTEGLPMGLVIIALFSIGAFIGLFTLAQGK